MVEQLSLEPPGITGAKIKEDAMKWRNANFAAYSRMVQKAELIYSEGRRTSIDALIQEVRYDMNIKPTDPQFKINNNIRAGLARMIIAERPHLAKIIETRKSKVDWY